MRLVSSRRPSASMVVALLALIVALGGSAYAATKVGTKDIRKGAVTAGKIRAGAVTTAKIRPAAVTATQLADDAVTGAKVLESTLGTVPSAERAASAERASRADSAASAETAETAAKAKVAETAANAETAKSAETATEFSRFVTSGLVTASKGETVPLASVGPFTIAGTCIDEGGIARRARILITTVQPHSFLFGTPPTSVYTEANFEPGTVAEIGDDIADDEPGWRANTTTSLWTAASADGAYFLRGAANTGIYVFGAECAFNVSFTNEGGAS